MQIQIRIARSELLARAIVHRVMTSPQYAPSAAAILHVILEKCCYMSVRDASVNIADVLGALAPLVSNVLEAGSPQEAHAVGLFMRELLTSLKRRLQKFAPAPDNRHRIRGQLSPPRFHPEGTLHPHRHRGELPDMTEREPRHHGDTGTREPIPEV